MKPNEIVNILRLEAKYQEKCIKSRLACEMRIAADCIERLQTELEHLTRKNEAIEGANKRAYDDGFSDCKKADDTLIANLRRELEASQRRERAAVEDIPHKCWSCAHGFYNNGGFDCDQAHYRGHNPNCLSWEWRGPRGAGEDKQDV